MPPSALSSFSATDPDGGPKVTFSGDELFTREAILKLKTRPKTIKRTTSIQSRLLVFTFLLALISHLFCTSCGEVGTAAQYSYKHVSAQFQSNKAAGDGANKKTVGVDKAQPETSVPNPCTYLPVRYGKRCSKH
ncbi:hypothetical protein JCGZ_06136 [Jatropha curcas]|uniref:Uncharacterized protein n=1 Tax=Jatropha curcas TaxID=180498 RepID=A0A067KXS7_JATCU|nr:hypothetical protein JCGZ_06136 [Jatropha curcas]